MRKGRSLFVFLVAAGIQLVIGWIYGLGTGLKLCLAIGGCLALRRIRFYIHREREFEQEYEQVVTYLEQLLCSYRRLGHTGRAMEDCSSLFEPGSRMGGAIQRARHVFMTGEGVEDGAILEAAFSEIEKEYDSRRMKIIHTFLCNGDRTGSDSRESLDILLEDLEFWKNRTSVYEKRKKFIKTECAVAAGLAAVLCYVSRLLTPEELGLRISDNPIYQICKVFCVCFRDAFTRTVTADRPDLSQAVSKMAGWRWKQRGRGRAPGKTVSDAGKRSGGSVWSLYSCGKKSAGEICPARVSLLAYDRHALSADRERLSGT